MQASLLIYAVNLDRLWSAYLFGVLFIVFFAVNVHHHYLKRTAKTREEYHNVHILLPIYGGMFGVIAMILFPYPGLAKWCWIPFLIEPGSAYFLFSIFNHEFFHIGGKSWDTHFKALDERFRDEDNTDAP